MSEYYKSLVTDEEVIKALTRDSQAREGTLQKPKLKPNLNFLQRTVSNMVSSNNRLIAKQTKKIMKETEKNSFYKPIQTPVNEKLHIDTIKDILTEKIDFVRSSEDKRKGTKYNPQQSRHMFRTQVKGKPTEMQLPTRKKLMVRPKTQLEVVREISIEGIVSLKSRKSASNLSKSHKTSAKKKLDNKKGPKIDYISREKVIQSLPESHKTTSKKQSNKKGPEIKDHNSRTKNKQSSPDKKVMSLGNTTSCSSESTEFPKKYTKKWVCDMGGTSKASILSESHKTSAKKQLANRKGPKVNHNLRKKYTQSSSDDEDISLEQTISSSCSVSSDFSKKETNKYVSDTSKSEDLETLHYIDESSRKKRNKYDVASDNDIGHPEEHLKELMIDDIIRNKDTSSSNGEIVILVDSASSSSNSDSSEFSEKTTQECISNTRGSENSETSSQYMYSRRKGNKINVASDNDIDNPRVNPKKPLIDHISRNQDTQNSSDDTVIILDDSASSSSCTDSSDLSDKKKKKYDSDIRGSEELQTLDHIDKSSRKKRKKYDVASDNDSGHPKRSPKQPRIDHTLLNKDTQRCPAGEVIILDDSASSSSSPDSSECPEKKTKEGKCKSSMKKRKIQCGIR